MGTEADLTNVASDATPDFPFVGESLALDFVNTAIVVRGRPRDLLATPADFTAWLRAASAIYPASSLATEAGAAGDERALQRVKAFRASLRALLSAAAAQELIKDADLAALNAVLGDGSLTVGVDADGHFVQQWSSRDTGPEGMLLPIARSAMALLTECDLARLHRCANERCVLLFYDTTKSGTRRWCSTSCMNRARSSRRYRERRAAGKG